MNKIRERNQFENDLGNMIRDEINVNLMVQINFELFSQLRDQISIKLYKQFNRQMRIQVVSHLSETVVGLK